LKVECGKYVAEHVRVCGGNSSGDPGLGRRRGCGAASTLLTSTTRRGNYIPRHQYRIFENWADTRLRVTLALLFSKAQSFQKVGNQGNRESSVALFRQSSRSRCNARPRGPTSHPIDHLPWLRVIAEFLPMQPNTLACIIRCHRKEGR
jgi:hypothetical protein